MAYKQYILPLIKRKDGDYEARINVESFQPTLYDWKTALPAKNRDFWQADQSQTVYIDQKVYLANGIGDFDRNLSQDGLLTPGIRSVELLDYLSYTGHDGTGASVNVTAPVNGSLCEEMFQNRAAIHTIFFSKVKPGPAVVTYNSGTTYSNTAILYHHNDWWCFGPNAPATLTGQEPGGTSGYTEDTTKWVRSRHTYIIADFNGNTITADEFSVKQWPDALSSVVHQRIRQVVKFECDDAAVRFQSHVVEHLFEFIDDTWVIDNMISGVASYGGIVNGAGHKTLTGGKSISANEIWEAVVKNDVGAVDVAGTYAHDGLHYIRLRHFIERLALTADCEHDFTSDLTTGMQFWIDKLQTIATDGTAHPWVVATVFNDQYHVKTPLAFDVSSTNINSSSYYTGYGGSPNYGIFNALHVCYEWLVGSNPLCDLHVAKMTSDLSLDWASPLSEGLKLFCDQFLQYQVTAINQSTKKPILRLLNRRDTGGAAIPKTLKPGKDTKKLQTNVSAQHVEINNRGGSDKLASPNRRGKAITKEVPWGAKLRGRSGGFNGTEAVYNAGLAPEDQTSCWRPLTGGLKNGGHLLCTNATVTDTGYTVGSGSRKLYKVEATSIDARVLTAGNIDGTDGDIVGFNNVSTQVSSVDAVALGLPDRGRNRFYVTCYHGESMATGTGISFAAGYDLIGNSGVIDTDDSTDFHWTERSFIPYIGRTLYIPARGIFTILEASDVAGVYHCTVDSALGAAGTGLDFRISGESPVTVNSDFLGGALLYVQDTSSSAAYILNGTNDLFNGTENTDQIERSGSNVPVLSVLKDYNGYRTTSFPKGTTDGDWSGMYAVSRCCYGLPDSGTPDTPPDYQYGNTLAGPLQAWAAELVGTFASRQIPFSWDSSAFLDVITDIKLLGTLTIDENGTSKNYYATGVRFNEFTRPGPSLVYTLTEQPATPTSIIDSNQFPIIKLGSGGYSGGASSVGGSGGSGTSGSPSNGGTVDLGDAVITAPNSVHRNRIQATGNDIPSLESVRKSADSNADHFAAYNEDLTTKTFYVDKDGAWHVELSADVVGATIKASASQTANQQEWQDSAGTVKASISAAGNITGQAGSLSGALNMNSHLINNVTDPVANQDAATKKYVDDGLAGIAGFVSLTPNGTTVVNAIVNQTATTVGLSIQQHASQSGNVMELRDSGGVAQTYFDSSLQFHTSGNIYVGTNANVYNLIATNTVTAASTTSGGSATECVTRDWTVTLKPDTSNTNVVQAQDNSTVALQVKARTGSSQDVFRAQDSSGNVTVTIGKSGNVGITHGTGNGLAIASSAGTTSVSLTNASTLAGANTIWELVNNGTNARGSVSIKSDGTETHGPLDNNSVVSKGYGISGQLSVPYKRITSASSPFQMDGTHMKILADCSGGNVTVKLPPNTKGSLSWVRKFSGSNTLTVQNSSGVTVFSWTGNGVGYSFTYDGSTGFEIGSAP